MHRHGLTATQKRLFKVKTTDSHHDQPVAPNLLAQEFVAHSDTYLWLLDHPDRTAAAWRKRGVPAVEINQLKDGEEVSKGDILAKWGTSGRKTTDIIQGLPRVSELFEIRKPRKEAVISAESGKVSLNGNNVNVDR